MHIFIEELLSKKKSAMDYVLIVVYIMLGLSVTFMLGFLLIVMMFSPKNTLIETVISLIPLAIFLAWFGIYKLIGLRSVEYEYTVINNNLDIDKIVSKKSRKRVVSVDIKSIEIMACTDDEENNDIYLNPPEETKIINCSALNKNMNTYFISTAFDGGRKMVIFQPTTKITEALAKFNPRLVKIYNP